MLGYIERLSAELQRPCEMACCVWRSSVKCEMSKWRSPTFGDLDDDDGVHGHGEGMSCALDHLIPLCIRFPCIHDCSYKLPLSTSTSPAQSPACAR